MPTRQIADQAVCPVPHRGFRPGSEVCPEPLAPGRMTTASLSGMAPAARSRTFEGSNVTAMPRTRSSRTPSLSRTRGTGPAVRLRPGQLPQAAQVSGHPRAANHDEGRPSNAISPFGLIAGLLEAGMTVDTDKPIPGPSAAKGASARTPCRRPRRSTTGNDRDHGGRGPTAALASGRSPIYACGELAG
jgi:hypothetical protein